ncbi:DUF1648 domain-containing protein [Flaviflexus massiliensis]|uniref:DUF1648 domain-containing protein n=1 Tax=Flaviflexus massiliensis TaxID=1522309 RepID=UPI00164D6760|nr:DUF1648 domain-containing protein [Flaviflexus massiliensis]
MSRQGKVPFRALDKAFFGIGLALCLAATIYTGLIYGSLPDTIPTHFDFSGKADAWGAKSSIWIGPIITLPTILVIVVVSMFNTNTTKNGKVLSPEGNVKVVDHMRRMLSLISPCIGVISWDLVLSMSGKLTGNLLILVAIGGILAVAIGYSLVIWRVMSKDPGVEGKEGPFL